MTAGQALALLLAIYAGGILAFVTLNYTLRWLEGGLEPGARPLAAAARELGWTLLLQLVYPLAFVSWPRRWRQARAPGETPVIFIHGFGHNRVCFFPAAWRLHRWGRGSLFAYNYNFFRPLAVNAERLAREVEDVLERTGATAVHLVGHSLGGLVARRYVERLGGHRWVRVMVAICSPFGGTRRRRMLPGPVGADLAVHPAGADPWGAPPADVSYVSLWSLADTIVVPARNASLGDHAAQGEDICFGGQGHLSLPASRLVSEVLRRRLG